MHKSQELTLQKAVIDFEDKEFTASLSFVTVSQVYALGDIISISRDSLALKTAKG